MNVLIIEDEPVTARRLKDLLLQADPELIVLAILDSVRSSVRWLQQHERPDLVMMDIQLSDGLSFDLFDQVELECPVIFTTAYQEYAIEAFKVNSVDYLLKPVALEDLQNALLKYRKLYEGKQPLPVIPRELLMDLRLQLAHPFKSRFMVKVGDRIKSIDVKEILYFYSLQKGTFIHTRDHRNYAIDQPLDALSEQLDPGLFHRINRQYIITHEAIRDLITLSGTRLKIILTGTGEADLYVSRERLPGFKEWLDQ